MTRSYIDGLEDAAKVCDGYAAVRDTGGVINPVTLGEVAAAREMARLIRKDAALEALNTENNEMVALSKGRLA